MEKNTVTWMPLFPHDLPMATLKNFDDIYFDICFDTRSQESNSSTQHENWNWEDFMETYNCPIYPVIHLDLRRKT